MTARTPPPLIAVVGATGTGKSALALALAEALADAEALGAEVINADAMQLYRGMDIGTAKLPVSERRGIPHHLFDVLQVREEATVAAYQPAARAAADEIGERGNVPILVGGSGLYVNSALYDFRFPGADPVVRARLEADLIERGLRALVDRLRALDPAAETTVDLQNSRRVVRALEVLEVTGHPIAESLPEAPVPLRPSLVVGVHEERPVLVERLDRRVDAMWAEGLLDEAQALAAEGLAAGPTASRAIGYAQALAQLNGELSEAEAIASTQALTRRYARRQVSWFKRLPDVHWVSSAESSDPEVMRRLLEAWAELRAA
ncbi:MULTISPECIES: tRNA (adenosine(37)-N6)-dimethylallyltransferase MiaA [unclassified Leucobacter]|uniref:tRNA (adenosine(37)-N6)-dimethylallyltransferase MiaA n=1 Tax=unclassified Leucobacter TaxID=2621730 RepID=UPI00165E7225|nr:MULTISPECIES: tRNA (adenosine(37)-N6)-dimethylallyltransferase MiaA [unclassified Leucobacter]MBC9925968.1 tRNA (adenosine(37)-N6)-dimethylallyltransferase MiaA [Leucobacter sp. cx-169]MBC9935621.1 tRNA (adenosine(37)-N6)-dimethylallyltransferase MiaA [Leucobacter sp. cx-87]